MGSLTKKNKYMHTPEGHKQAIQREHASPVKDHIGLFRQMSNDSLYQTRLYIRILTV